MFTIDDWATWKVYMEYIIPLALVEVYILYMIIAGIINAIKLKYVHIIHKKY